MTTNPVKNRIGHYLDNGDGTVTDTRTGLTWRRCALGQTWDGRTCTGQAGLHRLDRALALQLSFAGYNDWRVPTIDELETLIDPNRTDPAIDTEAFPNTPSQFFWSSSPPTADDSTYAAWLNFGDGNVGSHGDRNDSHRIRQVRGGGYAAKLSSFVGREVAELTDQAIEVVRCEENTQGDIATPVAIILERLDSLENRFEAFIDRIDGLVKLLSTDQSKTLDAINLLIHQSTNDTVDFTDQLAKLKQMLIPALKLAQTTSPSAPQLKADPEPEVQEVNSMAAFSAWLVDQDVISLSELRIQLLPLGLLSNAVINDINERALDLIGEPALIEDCENVIVQRAVLLKIIADSAQKNP